MLSIDKNSFKRDYENKFVQLHGKELKEGTNQQKYEALGSLVKDYVTNMWIETNKEYKEEELKQVYYFSMEFLLGKLLEDYLLNLGIDLPLITNLIIQLNLKCYHLDTSINDIDDLVEAIGGELHG